MTPNEHPETKATTADKATNAAPTRQRADIRFGPTEQFMMVADQISRGETVPIQTTGPHAAGQTGRENSEEGGLIARLPKCRKRKS
jgi:hypothetical protein